jgi:hypothetical protein
LLVTFNEFEKLRTRTAILRHTHGEDMVGPRTVNICDNVRALIALNFLEAERRHRLPELGNGTTCRANIGFKRNLFCDPQQLTILLENLEKVPNTLYSSHYPFSYMSPCSISICLDQRARTAVGLCSRKVTPETTSA